MRIGREYLRRLCFAGLVGSSWSCGVDPKPPLGEVVLHVDTDLPAPRIAGRIRIDLYDAEGIWFESRELARPNAADWPLSFSVFTQEAVKKRVWIRLRVFPEGKVRDYRGERFQDWPDVLSTLPEGDGQPRLIRDGVDETPSREPEPLLTVDRLVLVEIPREQVRHAIVTLRGACAGTSSRLSNTPSRGPTADESESCIDEPLTRAIVRPEPLFDLPPSGGSRQGTWMNEACEVSVPAGRACIPGGATVFGNRSLVFADVIDAAPERVVGVQRFAMDVGEVTVGVFRAALAIGFTPPQMPTTNDGPLSPDGDAACTYTSAAADREDYPLNCVTWDTARAYCLFLGGDLPTEVQWELAATLEGRLRKTSFPWGDRDPSCDEAIFGRAALSGIPGQCAASGEGPVRFGTNDALDVTPAGVRSLAGSMSEWARDGGAGYDDPCWATGVVDPWCSPQSEDRSVRGGAWASPSPTLVGTFRMARSRDLASNFIGLRCAYEVRP